MFGKILKILEEVCFYPQQGPQIKYPHKDL